MEGGWGMGVGRRGNEDGGRWLVEGGRDRG